MTHFETAVRSPDEKAIAAERQDLLYQLEAMHKKCAQLHGELSRAKSDNEMLKETIVHMSMKLVGVSN